MNEKRGRKTGQKKTNDQRSREMKWLLGRSRLVHGRRRKPINGRV